MSPEELKAHARRVPEELLTQGDLAVADAVFAPDLVHHGPTPHAPGVAGAKQFALALRRAFPDLCAIVEDEIAEGDTVVQRLTLSGTHRGEYSASRRPAGAPPGNWWPSSASARTGRSRSTGPARTSIGLLRQLGALPTSETARESDAAGEGIA